MTIVWRSLSFRHTCGKQGTILEVVASSDGELALGGLCITCGVDFSTHFKMAEVISVCAIKDYLEQAEETPAERTLNNYVPTGKPN